MLNWIGATSVLLLIKHETSGLPPSQIYACLPLSLYNPVYFPQLHDYRCQHICPRTRVLLNERYYWGGNSKFLTLNKIVKHIKKG